jgi:DNA-binding NtrC family response regulator
MAVSRYLKNWQSMIRGNASLAAPPAMWDLYKLIGQTAASDATVLLTGESGIR